MQELSTRGQREGFRPATPRDSAGVFGPRSWIDSVVDREVREDHQHPQTPPCEEQQPCFFAQLVQVGENVPSQQRNVPPGCGCGWGWGCGAVTVIDSVR